MCCRNVMRIALYVALAVCVAAPAAAAVKLPALFSDNMVLQRDMPVPVWGWADKGEEVTVSVAGQTLTTKADDHGQWKVVLAKLHLGQPLEMTVKGSSGNAISLKNILAGEVWVCSGQSNMEMGIDRCNNAKEEIAAADYPQIRLFLVLRTKKTKPAEDVKGTWKRCTPKNIAAGGWGGFSATAYYFGRMLHKELGVPIGLIDTTWGGTPAEFWTSRKALEANPALKALADRKDASSLYNGMIAPLIPYAIRGAIWYQGESNLARAYEYRSLFPAMIANWRADWGRGAFPFFFVQLAPFRYKGQNPANYAELCEAQRMTL
ncbi:MAG: sialate O-acetylesterase, partial [Thermoguttaceae bacterium]